MLYFNRIDVFFKKRYFLNKGFTFQPDLCNACHDLLMMSMNLSDITILNIKGPDYCCIISELAKLRP